MYYNILYANPDGAAYCVLAEANKAEEAKTKFIEKNPTLTFLTIWERPDFIPVKSTESKKQSNFDLLGQDIEAMAEALLHASAGGCPPETEDNCDKECLGWDACHECYLKWLKMEADI